MMGRQAGIFLVILLLLTPPDAAAIEPNAATCFGYVLAKTKAAGLPSNQVEELEPFFQVYYSMHGVDWDDQKAEGISALKRTNDEVGPTPFEINCNQLFLEVADFTQKALEKYGNQ